MILKQKQSQSRLTNSLLCVFGLITSLLILEISIRIKETINNRISFFEQPYSKWDNHIGWLGREHKIGSPSNKKSVLVIGDSFTDGLSVSPSEMWFNVFRDIIPDSRIIAYGGMGYGNLQELMILENYLKDKKPELIVMQLCTNDLINNSLYLESRSMMQRSPAPKPYLNENGNIEMHLPRRMENVIKLLISHSYLANKISLGIDRILAILAKEKKIDSIEYEIQRKGFSFEPFRKSIQITTEILSRIKNASGSTKLIFVLIDDGEPYTTAFRSIAQNLNAPIIIPRKSYTFTAEHYLEDGAHYNPLGNKVVGEIIKNIIFEKRII